MGRVKNPKKDKNQFLSLKKSFPPQNGAFRDKN
jgi:hypothetical protein